MECWMSHIRWTLAFRSVDVHLNRNLNAPMALRQAQRTTRFNYCHFRASHCCCSTADVLSYCEISYANAMDQCGTWIRTANSPAYTHAHISRYDITCSPPLSLCRWLIGSIINDGHPLLALLFVVRIVAVAILVFSSTDEWCIEVVICERVSFSCHTKAFAMHLAFLSCNPMHY